MPGVTYSPASYAVRSVSRLRGGSARLAMGALLAFVVVVFACPGTVIPELAPYVPAKGIAALALIGLVGAVLFYGRRLVGGGWVGAGLLTVLGIALASPLWSSWPDASVAAAAELAKFVVVYVVVVNVIDSPKRLRTFMTTIVLASLFPCIGAIKNYVLGQNLVEGNRAAWVSSFGNPDELAYYMVFAIPLALALREMTESRWKRFTLLALIMLFGTATFLSASRGGIVTMAAVLLVWWLRELRKGRIGLWMGLALAVGLTFVPSHIWNRTRTLTQYQDDVSAMGRIWTTEAGLKMFMHSPWGGMGAGTFVANYPSYAPIEAADNASAMAAHNSFVQILAEEGLFALCGFVVAVAFGLWLTRRQAEADHMVDAGAAGVQGGMLAFVLSSLTGGIALSWPIYWCLGMAAALPRIRRHEGEPCPPSS